MKRFILGILILLSLVSCESLADKGRCIRLLRDESNLRYALPCESFKIGRIEGGTAVIVDNYWCFWIDDNDQVYCVNGHSKTVFKAYNTTLCKDAPINATFSDIEKIVE